jgi:hypothetical protein
MNNSERGPTHPTLALKEREAVVQKAVVNYRK